MIAEQTVKARAVEGALGVAGTGSEQVAISFLLLEGPNEGQRITWYGYFSDKSIDFTLEALENCGWQGDNLSDLSGIDRNEVYLVIEHEEDREGQPRARVRYVNASGGIAMKERMSAGEAAMFAERMRGTVLARRQAKGQTPIAQQRTNNTRRQSALPAAPPHSDDDIPY